jgi:hypothetical protein
MAVASIAVPPDPKRDAKRDAKAALLAPFVGSWPKHTLKQAWGSFEAGTTFRRAPGSHGERYLVNAVACQCPDYQQFGHICKHVRAVVLFEQERAATVAAPAPARKSYADLFPACPCGDVAEAGGLCDRCASDREWQARRDQFATV